MVYVMALKKSKNKLFLEARYEKVLNAKKYSVKEKRKIETNRKREREREREVRKRTKYCIISA